MRAVGRFLLVTAMGIVSGQAASGTVYTAAEVIAYTRGAGVSPSLTDPSAALSLPSQSTGSGAADGNFSPSNPHYRAGEIVQIGQGGQITLRLERFVHPLPGTPSLGVWENVFLIMGPGDLAGAPASVFGADSAMLEASADGINFYPVGVFSFDWFGNYWTDSPGPYAKLPGSIRADFGTPHGRSLPEFSGLSYGGVLSLLNETGGGTWIDLSSSGLDRVGWVRFSGVSAGLTLEIDAVAINSALAGAPTAIPQLRIEISNSETRVIVPNAPAHAVYKLQHSHGPYGGWQDLDAPRTRSGGDLVFADRTSPRPGQHFYRVVMP